MDFLFFRESLATINYFRLFLPLLLDVPGLENMQFQLLCKSQKSKVDHIRSLLSVTIVAEIGCLPKIRMKPEFYIMNDLCDCFDGPFKLEIGDIKNPSIYNLKLPKI